MWDDIDFSELPFFQVPEFGQTPLPSFNWEDIFGPGVDVGESVSGQFPGPGTGTDNPFLPPPLPGETPGQPGGIEGPGGNAPGAGLPFDIGTSLGGPGGGSWSDLLKSIFPGMSGQGIGLPEILGLLTALGGTAYSNQQNKESVKQIQEAADKANAYAENMIGGARSAFDPFIAQGTKANADLAGMVGKSGLFGQFGSPVGSNLPPMKPLHGMMTLQQLAGRY